MGIKTSVVVTTINPPTEAVLALGEGCRHLGYEFIVIGDTKGPNSFHVEGASFFDIAAQRATEFQFAALCPTKHYARKNIGYLIAMKSGCDRILETDDDNFPNHDFWDIRSKHQEVTVNEEAGWVNVYRYFSDQNIWPRGHHLKEVQKLPKAFEDLKISPALCPIQQGLANDNPDVDAIYRLTLPLPVTFRNDRRLSLAAGAWCPFNSQNTSWWKEAFPLMYLPYYCSFRMTDIWRSFVAQRIAWANGWSVMFYEPTVRQDRNEHDLMVDFEEEISGYLNNGKIASALEKIALPAGADQIADNMRLCYNTLIDLGLVGPQEAKLLDAWLSDIATLAD